MGEIVTQGSIEQEAADQPRRFIVVTTQRAGSSWLMGRLNSVPRAQGHLELFYNDVRRVPARAGRDDFPRFFEIGRTFGKRTRAGNVFAYLDEFYSRSGAVGFKVMYSQLREYPEVLLYIAVRRLPVIHLARNNDLDVVLSGELANATQTFHATADESADELPALTLDPQTVLARVRRLEKKRNFMRRCLKLLPVPLHEVSYEDLNKTESAFLDVCRFIGVAGHKEDRSTQRLTKRQRRPRAEAIQNYEQVSATLREYGYQHLLES